MQNRQQNMVEKNLLLFTIGNITLTSDQVLHQNNPHIQQRKQKNLHSIFHTRINIQKKYTKGKENIEMMRTISEAIHNPQEFSKWKKAKT